MGDYTVLCEPDVHYHSLPRTGSYELRTIVRCEECGQRFWLRQGEYGRNWQPLRWYHWRLRRCLKKERL